MHLFSLQELFRLNVPCSKCTHYIGLTEVVDGEDEHETCLKLHNGVLLVQVLRSSTNVAYLIVRLKTLFSENFFSIFR